MKVDHLPLLGPPSSRALLSSLSTLLFIDPGELVLIPSVDLPSTGSWFPQLRRDQTVRVGCRSAEDPQSGLRNEAGQAMPARVSHCLQVDDDRLVLLVLLEVQQFRVLKHCGFESNPLQSSHVSSSSSVPSNPGHRHCVYRVMSSASTPSRVRHWGV
ncbi:hypothetical protein Henu3_gp14 [Mycobacterium phage Henu3 PeY-2017]|nr:hypothetical protein Henu3_gp14 [Mycobacterium phage Henu3 PeY-2017]